MQLGVARGEMTQVLIVGAGPTGLSLALELARQGVSFRLVDKAAQGCQFLQAGSVHAKTLEIFAGLGCLDGFLQEGQKVLRSITCVPPRRQIARTDYEDIESPYPFLLQIEQYRTERLLAAHLALSGHAPEREVELLDFHEEGERVQCHLRHSDGRVEELEVDYLVGCDGAHSCVRHGLEGATFDGVSYPEWFVTADLAMESDLSDDTFWIFLAEQGALFIFPFRDGRVGVVGECLPDRDGEVFLAEMQALADERGPGGIRFSAPRWMSRFKVNGRQVDRYRDGRVFLAGDAAHVQSPMGGKGMNTGIQDAHNLGWRLGHVLRGAAHPTLLDGYQKERHHAGQETLDYSNRMQTNTVQNKYAPGKTGMIQSNLRKPVSTYSGQQRMLGLGSEVSLTYRGTHPHLSSWQGPPRQWPDATGRHPEQQNWRNFSDAPQPGDRCPDATLTTLTGEERQLYAILAGPQHHLLVFQGGRVSEQARIHVCVLAAQLQRRLDGWAQVHVILHAPTELAEGLHAWLDPRCHLHLRYGAKEDTLYWLRPDCYIGYRSQPAEAEPFLAYLGSLHP